MASAECDDFYGSGTTINKYLQNIFPKNFAMFEICD